MRKALAILAIMLMAFAVPVGTCETDAEDPDIVLIDLGNGTTYWSSAVPGGSMADALSAAAGSLGIDCSVSGGRISSLEGLSDHSVGGAPCAWRTYTWTDGAWRTGASLSDAYAGGAFAVGFYPAGTCPVETPGSMFSWMSAGGDSSASSVSDGSGPGTAATPMEWYRTYTTGFVCSDILVAGNLMYHTTNGAYKASGEDGDPWLYCLDRHTGDVVWKHRFEYNGGYDTTTPVILGDLIVANSAAGITYCLDRFTGELIDSVERGYDYPTDQDGNVVWRGRTFVTGGTTPVCDSGAIYFGTSDGHVLCYSASRDSGLTLLWDYCPPATVSGGEYTGTRGSFYYHPPVIADVDGKRVLFIGSYEGYLYSVDASTGKGIWTQRLIDLGDSNRPHPGTPGSVGSVSVLPDGRLLVSCSDGGLSSLTGYTVCVDAATGKGPDGSDCWWRIDALCNSVASPDGFYAYVSPSYGGASELASADGGTVPVTSAVYKFDLDGKVVWVSSEYPLIKAGLVLADGRIYFNDYSAGSFWPTGGGLTAIDAEDGSEVWRVRLTPYSGTSYSMVSPTVADGRIYVGNDYGAVYCVSDIQGRSPDDGGEIVLRNAGFMHWSWFALGAVVLIGLVGLYRLY